MNVNMAFALLNGPLVDIVQTKTEVGNVCLYLCSALALASCLGPARKPQGKSDSDLKPSACSLQSTAEPHQGLQKLA